MEPMAHLNGALLRRLSGRLVGTLPVGGVRWRLNGARTRTFGLLRLKS